MTDDLDTHTNNTKTHDVHWEQMRRDMGVLARYINDEFNPDHIIGIERGGLPIAVNISHKLDVPMSTVPATYYDDKSTTDQVIVPEFNLNLKSEYAYSEGEMPESVTIVDDIVDTGATMTTVNSIVEAELPERTEINTVSWFADHTLEEIPDYNLVDIDTDTWIVFPWEQ